MCGCQLRRHREERRPARGAQPFVGGDGEEVDVGGADRQPSGRLGPVEDGERPDLSGGTGDRRKIGDLAGRGLRSGEGHERRGRVDRLGEGVKRRGAHPHAAVGVDGEWVDAGGEFDVGDEDPRAVGKCRGDRGEQLGHGRPGGHLICGNTDEAAEEFAAGVDRFRPPRPRHAADPLLVEGSLHRLPPAPRRRTV